VRRRRRRGLGAVAIGDQICVAGGGPIVGGEVRSAVHEAFTLGQALNAAARAMMDTTQFPLVQMLPHTGQTLSTRLV
jgi:hypothetical protein